MKRILIGVILLCNTKFIVAQLVPSVEPDGKCLYKNEKTGKYLNYSYDECSDFIGDEALVKNDGKYMIINSSEAVLMEFSHKFMRHIKAGEYIFRNDSVAGSVNSKGEIIKEAKFKAYYKGGIVTELLILQTDSLVGIFSDLKGLLLPIEYVPSDFQSTFMWDGDLYFDEKAVFCMKHKGKWGITNVYGEVIVPFEYDKVNHGYYDDLVGVSKNSKWGLIDKKGRIVVPIENDHYFGRFGWGASQAGKEHNPYILLKDGKIVFYDEAVKKTVTSIAKGKYYWERADHSSLLYKGKIGLVDHKGSIVVPFEYDEITVPLVEDSIKTIPVYQVRKETQWALFKPGKGLITSFVECENLVCSYAQKKLVCCMKKNGKVSVNDLNLKPISITEYDGYEYNQGKLYVLKDGKLGEFLLDGKVKWE